MTDRRRTHREDTEARPDETTAVNRHLRMPTCKRRPSPEPDPLRPALGARPDEVAARSVAGACAGRNDSDGAAGIERDRGVGPSVRVVSSGSRERRARPRSRAEFGFPVRHRQERQGRGEGADRPPSESRPARQGARALTRSDRGGQRRSLALCG